MYAQFAYIRVPGPLPIELPTVLLVVLPIQLLVELLFELPIGNTYSPTRPIQLIQ